MTNMYMVTTGEWMFAPEDTFFEKPADKHFSTITDGPYTTYVKAEMAANMHIRRYSPRYMTIKDDFEQHAIGGPDGPHGNACSWVRNLTYHDHTNTFGDQDGWQEIRMVAVDTMP